MSSFLDRLPARDTYTQGEEFKTLGGLAYNTNSTVEDIKAQNEGLGSLQPGQQLKAGYEAKDAIPSLDTYSEVDLMELDTEGIEAYFSGKESTVGGYEARNPKSTAKGKYQLLDSIREAQANKLSIPIENSLEPENQEKIFISLVKDYSSILTEMGLPKTSSKLYAIHQLGESRFKRYESDSLTGSDIRTMRDNLPAKSQKGSKEKVIANWKAIYDPEKL